MACSYLYFWWLAGVLTWLQAPLTTVVILYLGIRIVGIVFLAAMAFCFGWLTGALTWLQAPLETVVILYLGIRIVGIAFLAAMAALVVFILLQVRHCQLKLARTC